MKSACLLASADYEIKADIDFVRNKNLFFILLVRYVSVF